GTDLTLSPLFNSSGLVGYWKFDEGSGTSTQDSSGNGNTGVISGSPSWVTGKIGDAINFRGNTTDSVTIATSSILDTDIHTISFWILFTNSSASWYQIIAFPPSSPSSTDRSPGIWTYLGSNVDVHWRYDPNNTGANRAGPNGENTSFSQNVWYHIVGVKNGATLTLYVNGSQTETVTVANPKKTGSAPLYFGRRANGSYAAFMQLDDVRIYNRALSAAEIYALYSATR
ncbi:MAG: LamG domain-containing protein, partial [bacterium]|nr:LamG domain-containing protein [bacterium]